MSHDLGQNFSALVLKLDTDSSKAWQTKFEVTLFRHDGSRSSETIQFATSADATAEDELRRAYFGVAQPVLAAMRARAYSGTHRP